jgi:seryl-tRNA synthetase
MINIKQLRESPEKVRVALTRRDPAHLETLDRILRLDESRRELLAKVEQLKARRNKSSEEVARLKKSNEDASVLLAELRDLSGTIKNIDQEVRSVDAELQQTALQVPNLPLEELPDGGAEDYEVVKAWGEPSTHEFEARPHWELGEALGILDLPRGATISGSGFPLFVGMGGALVGESHAGRPHSRSWISGGCSTTARERRLGTGYGPAAGSREQYVRHEGRPIPRPDRRSAGD